MKKDPNTLIYQRIVISSLLFVFCYTIKAQHFNSHSEKIYIQLDNKVYTNDKTIWFKAIVTTADSNTPTSYSNVLYLELINPDEQIIDKKIIKLNDGIGTGNFDLDPMYKEGLYQIRAYTKWNENFGADFFFTDYVQIFQTYNIKNTGLFEAVHLIEKENNTKQLNIEFNTAIADSFPGKKINLKLQLDHQNDSLVIKRNNENKYKVDYTIPEKTNYVTLQVNSNNKTKYTKIIALNKDNIDLQFFPESGELVHGYASIVAFKALDCTGKGIPVEGKILNNKDSVIAFFKSNPLGMGTFTMAKPDSNVTYKAQIATTNNTSIIFPFPKVTSKGNQLSVLQKNNSIQVTASSNYLKDDSIYLQVTSRGTIYYESKIPFQKGIVTYSFNKELFPEGIICFKMFNKNMQPVAARLFFNQQPANKMNIELTTNNPNYAQRDSTIVTIKTTDNAGQPLKANISVKVINNQQLGEIHEKQNNILSYFLLRSELKGEINNPGFYFKEGTNRYPDLDALMLTQGWSKYNYAKLPDTISYMPEKSLSISGRVNRKNPVQLTLMTFGKNREFQNLTTDSLGRFQFDIMDNFGEPLEILIQSANKSGKKRDYTIELDKKEPLPVSFHHFLEIEKPDSTINEFVIKNLERKKIDDSFPLSEGTIRLKEVTVKSYKMTPERKMMAEEHGMPKYVIDGKEIKAKEKNWSYGLYSVLMENYADKVEIVRQKGNLTAYILGTDFTMVVIDGRPVRYNEKHMFPPTRIEPQIPNDSIMDESILVQSIPPSEVISVEIIPCAKNRITLIQKACPAAGPDTYQRIQCLGVVSIYTWAGKGIYGAIPPVGLLKTKIDAFSAPREFYSPKYSRLNPNDWVKPDLRALVHWSPVLNSDSTGIATTSYFNADNPGKMKVIVEAISEDGKIGYKELIYDVTSEKLNYAIKQKQD